MFYSCSFLILLAKKSFAAGRERHAMLSFSNGTEESEILLSKRYRYI